MTFNPKFEAKLLSDYCRKRIFVSELLSKKNIHYGNTIINNSPSWRCQRRKRAQKRYTASEAIRKVCDFIASDKNF